MLFDCGFVLADHHILLPTAAADAALSLAFQTGGGERISFASCFVSRMWPATGHVYARSL